MPRAGNRRLRLCFTIAGWRHKTREVGTKYNRQEVTGLDTLSQWDIPHLRRKWKGHIGVVLDTSNSTEA